MQGKFISFEGIDGAGKSTHVAWCVEFLQSQGKRVCAVREPGGTPLGESLRANLLSASMAPLTETLLMFASRHHLLEQTIRPALHQGDWVVSDRFVDASYAYQGGGRGVANHVLDWLSETCVGETLPDCTFWFCAPLEVAWQRRTHFRSRDTADGSPPHAPDRFEQENHAFFERVANGYALRYQQCQPRIIRIDSTKNITEIQDILAAHLRQLIARDTSPPIDTACRVNGQA